MTFRKKLIIAFSIVIGIPVVLNIAAFLIVGNLPEMGGPPPDELITDYDTLIKNVAGRGWLVVMIVLIAALGIKLRVSEMDIGITKYTETSLKAQADKYGAMMELMLRFADQTEAVQVWGLTDNMSWRTGQFPLLFDRNRNPKPAFFGVIEAIEE